MLILLPDHQLRTILQRLRQMRGLDLFAPRQVGYRARQLQYAVIGSCRQIVLRHRRPHQTLTFILQLAKLPDLPDTHICITNDL